MVEENLPVNRGQVVSRVPMTSTLEALLRPDLFRKEPIFTRPLELPKKGDFECTWNLCLGGCATRSAYSKIDLNTGLVVKNENPHSYSEGREDPLCPAWTVLALKQGVLRQGLLEKIHSRILERSRRINPADFPYVGG